MASNTEMRSIFTLGGIRMFSSTFLAFAFRNENNHDGKTVQLTVGIKSTRFPELKLLGNFRVRPIFSLRAAF